MQLLALHECLGLRLWYLASPSPSPPLSHSQHTHAHVRTIQIYNTIRNSIQEQQHSSEKVDLRLIVRSIIASSYICPAVAS